MKLLLLVLSVAPTMGASPDAAHQDTVAIDQCFNLFEQLGLPGFASSLLPSICAKGDVNLCTQDAELTLTVGTAISLPLSVGDGTSDAKQEVCVPNVLTGDLASTCDDPCISLSKAAVATTGLAGCLNLKLSCRAPRLNSGVCSGDCFAPNTPQQSQSPEPGTCGTKDRPGAT